jgi:rhodanese-related sulfurtransferase
MGYKNVTWFPGGADGWAGAGFETEPAEPMAIP